MAYRKSLQNSSNPPYELWVSSVDDNGVPLDPSFVSAAKQIGSGFFRYRQRELGCASLTNDLVQEAVRAATLAKREKPVTNYVAYLLAVFFRIVDKFLDREARTVPFGDAELEDLAQTRNRDTSADGVERRIELKEILRYLDEETREIADLRLQGFFMTEIAKEHGVTLTCLAHRWERGVERAMKKLLESRKRDEGQSEG
jgi:DNA-directed RNA polymerase specialized sigma24 family protein